jgi:predicted transcriptional regulator of viral defense system
MGSRQDRWRRLLRYATRQGGLFTARQAVEAGYSPALQHHHAAAGNWLRVERGIYRLPLWPAAEHEGFVLAQLWSGGKAVVSHDSALQYYELSDVLPDAVHLTVPRTFRKRRDGFVLHRAELSKAEVREANGFKVTTPVRTVSDIAASDLSPEHLNRAVHDGLRQGLLTKKALIDAALDLPNAPAVRLRAALRAEAVAP